MRSSRGERAAPRGARHAGLGLQLDGRWEAEAASQPAEWRRRRQRSGVDPPVPTRPEGPGLTPALALLRRRHLLPHGPRSGKVDAPGGPSRRAHLLPCAPAPPPPRPPIPYARAAQSPIGYPVYPRPLLHRYCGHWCPNESSAPRAAHSPSPITPPSPPWALASAALARTAAASHHPPPSPSPPAPSPPPPLPSRPPHCQRLRPQRPRPRPRHPPPRPRRRRPARRPRRL